MAANMAATKVRNVMNQAVQSMAFVSAQNTDYDLTVKAATGLLRDRYKAYSSAVQVEAYDPILMTSCDECKGPKQS